MNFSDLLDCLDCLERAEKPGRARAKASKCNTGKLPDDEIIKYRQMVSDGNYMNNAVIKTAEIITEALNGYGKS